MSAIIGKENFLASHYEKIVLAVGLLALAGGIAFYAVSAGDGVDEELKRAAHRIGRPSEKTGVEPIAPMSFGEASRQAKTPPVIVEIPDDAESFLASERRIKCRCGKVMPAGLETCPACQTSLVAVNEVDEETKKQEAWSKKYGVAIDSADADGDGFTNEEEYAAGTDPTSKREHPDYFESLTLQLPLKETTVPFVLRAANKIPAGWRCEFYNPKLKNDYGQAGRTFTATVGEEIVIATRGKTGAEVKTSTGFKLKAFTQKEERRAIAGNKAMTKVVDVSVATLERVSDGKTVDLTIQTGSKNLRFAPVDVQATIVYTRGETKTFTVVAGEAIDLNGSKYTIVSIKPVGKGAEVVLESAETGKAQTLKALE